MARSTGGPSAGDFTGRQKAQANKEQLLADQEQADQAAQQRAADQQIDMNGIFDGKSEERIDTPGPHEVLVVEEEPVPSFGGSSYPREEIFTGQEDPEDAPPPAPAKAFVMPPPQVLRSANAVVRISEDVEKMTYGMQNGEPNNYNFKEGRAYRVPTSVAEHLNQLGLVSQWIG
jgi:hypothetical protein